MGQDFLEVQYVFIFFRPLKRMYLKLSPNVQKKNKNNLIGMTEKQ